jgi:hypothetical protein
MQRLIKHQIREILGIVIFAGLTATPLKMPGQHPVDRAKEVAGGRARIDVTRQKQGASKA